MAYFTLPSLRAFIYETSNLDIGVDATRHEPGKIEASGDLRVDPMAHFGGDHRTVYIPGSTVADIGTKATCFDGFDSQSSTRWGESLALFLLRLG